MNPRCRRSVINASCHACLPESYRGILSEHIAAPAPRDWVSLQRLIAVVIGRDLPDPRTTIGEAIRCVEYTLPALEIVDSRIENWNIGLVDTVANNALSGAFVPGTSPKKLGDVDLRLCGMVLESSGEAVSFGAGGGMSWQSAQRSRLAGSQARFVGRTACRRRRSAVWCARADGERVVRRPVHRAYRRGGGGPRGVRGMRSLSICGA